MEPISLFEPVLEKLGPLKILDLIALLTLPLWGLYKFFPSIFNELVTLIPGDFFPYWLQSFTLVLVKVFAALSSMVLITLLTLGLTKIIQSLLRALFGRYDCREDKIRNHLIKSLLSTYIRLALYTTAMAIFSQMVLNNSIPVTYLHSSNAYWYTVFPIELFVILAILLFILPF